MTLDDIVVTVTSSAQGDLSPDMASVKGKSFNMVLSPLGSEVDVAGAEALTYEMGGESRNLSSGFKTFFPDLAGKPVKIGDTWPSSSSVEEKTGSMVITVDLQNVNTLEGFETVDGMECARISVGRHRDDHRHREPGGHGPDLLGDQQRQRRLVLRGQGRASTSRGPPNRRPRCPSTSPPRA